MKTFVACWMGLGLALVSSNASAITVEGYTLPDEVQVEDGGKRTTLKINGATLRQKTIFKVNVYAGGLYVEKPSSDAGAILASAGPKRLTQRFVRDVGADKIRDSWQESIEANCEDRREACAAMDSKFKQFLAFFTDVKDGDVVQLDFLQSGLRMNFSGKPSKTEVIPGKDISDFALSMFIGEKADEDLRNGLVPQSTKQ